MTSELRLHGVDLERDGGRGSERARLPRHSRAVAPCRRIGGGGRAGWLSSGRWWRLPLPRARQWCGAQPQALPQPGASKDGGCLLRPSLIHERPSIFARGCTMIHSLHQLFLSSEMLKAEYICQPKALLCVSATNSWVGKVPTIGYPISQKVCLQMLPGNHCNLNPKQIIFQTSAESLADVSSSFLTDLLVAVVSTLFLCRSNRRRRAHGWRPNQDLLGFLMGAPQEGGDSSSSRSPLNKAAGGDHMYKI